MGWPDGFLSLSHNRSITFCHCRLREKHKASHWCEGGTTLDTYDCKKLLQRTSCVENTLWCCSDLWDILSKIVSSTQYHFLHCTILPGCIYNLFLLKEILSCSHIKRDISEVDLWSLTWNLTLKFKLVVRILSSFIVFFSVSGTVWKPVWWSMMLFYLL